ncbi:MAG: LysM peptidoglycan-binding domain-containing protein, partial [Burkholderiaceae bacterium]|nr:LysM peptidoglycan-binding domain-containing protein [Burkholderiaceae bacterium]
MKRLVYPLAVVVCAALTACGTSETQAPVEDRSVGYMPQSAPVVGPGYYAVQKGDTLYRISRAKGQTVADLVAWNNLSDPNAINEGQVLRVVPPEAGGAAPAPASAQTAAVADSSRDVQPLAASDAPP